MNFERISSFSSFSFHSKMETKKPFMCILSHNKNSVPSIFLHLSFFLSFPLSLSLSHKIRKKVREEKRKYQREREEEEKRNCPENLNTEKEGRRKHQHKSRNLVFNIISIIFYSLLCLFPFSLLFFFLSLSLSLLVHVK